MARLDQELTLYVSGDAWNKQAVAVYSDAVSEAKAQLKASPPEEKAQVAAKVEALANSDTKDAVANFGAVLRSENGKFVPALVEVLKQPREAIPESLQTLMVTAIDWRKDNFKKERETSPSMQNDVSVLLTAAKSHFTPDADQSPETLAKRVRYVPQAVAAGNSYMAQLTERSAAANKHFLSAITDISTSPQSAVKWCEGLANYTRQEMGDTLHQLHAVINQPSMTTGQLWQTYSPVMQVQAAEVLKSADSYIGKGMPFLVRQNENDLSLKPETILGRGEVLAKVESFATAQPKTPEIPGQVPVTPRPTIGLAMGPTIGNA